MKQFGKPPPFSKRPSLSTNPPISEKNFHDPPLCPILKNVTHPPLYPTPVSVDQRKPGEEKKDY